jgi:hypothetical protein
VPIISVPQAFNEDDLYIDLGSIFGQLLFLKREGFNFAGSIKLEAATRSSGRWRPIADGHPLRRARSSSLSTSACHGRIQLALAHQTSHVPGSMDHHDRWVTSRGQRTAAGDAGPGAVARPA